MPTGTVQKTQKKPAISKTLPSRVRMEQEMIIKRETDQWMNEHYKNRA